jgi:hypothetical protein
MFSRILVALIAAMSITSVASAGEGAGRITGLIPFATTEEVFFIKVETASNLPSCNSSQRFVLRSSAINFKTNVASLLAAYHAGTVVRIIGGGTCNTWSNSEDVAYICFGETPC